MPFFIVKWDLTILIEVKMYLHVSLFFLKYFHVRCMFSNRPFRFFKLNLTLTEFSPICPPQTWRLNKQNIHQNSLLKMRYTHHNKKLSSPVYDGFLKFFFF